MQSDIQPGLMSCRMLTLVPSLPEAHSGEELFAETHLLETAMPQGLKFAGGAGATLMEVCRRCRSHPDGKC